MTLRALAARVRRYYPRWRLNKVVTDYGASNEVAVQAVLLDFYPVLKVLLEPSIRLAALRWRLRNFGPVQMKWSGSSVILNVRTCISNRAHSKMQSC